MASCDLCQRNVSKGTVSPPGKLSLVETPFSVICVDIVGPISPPSEGFQYILTTIDMYTRFPEAVPLKNISTSTVAEALLNMFSRVGLPSVLWRCWLGDRKGIRPVKNRVVGYWRGYLLERGADLHTAQLMPLPLTVSCSRLVLPFWYRLIQVVLEKRPLNGCWCCCCAVNWNTFLRLYKWLLIGCQYLNISCRYYSAFKCSSFWLMSYTFYCNSQFQC